MSKYKRRMKIQFQCSINIKCIKEKNRGEKEEERTVEE